MNSKEKPAQSVGNAKIRGEFDTDAETTVVPNTNDAVLFSRLRSNRDGKMTGSFLAGTVLARRYKILEPIDGDSFKAHDLALDQTVTVRQATATSHRKGDTWRQKVQQLASVRDPNFLNVLDVVFDQSNDFVFVITERPRGPSIGDLLKERSRFELEDVLRLMTPLAGSLDLAATLTCCPNPISACWLFTETRRSFAVDSERRPLSEWPPFFVKMDVWELVRPRKNTWPLVTSKAQGSSSPGLAARQAALLTYELLGGKIKKQGKVKRWFQPLSGLGDAVNTILYRGLEGSSLFESSESFFQRLESAILSGSGESRALPAPALETQKHSITSSGPYDVTREFNRHTVRLGTVAVSAVVSAALVFGVLIQDRHPKTADLTGEARQAAGDLLLNADLSGLPFEVMGSNGKRFTGETPARPQQLNPGSYSVYLRPGGSPEKERTVQITSGQATNLDHECIGTSSQENPSPPMEAAASTPTPVLGSIPEKINLNAQANISSWSPAHRQDSAGVIQPKNPKVTYRSRLSSAEVKMRLIALWRQSLVRSEKSRSWTLLSNSKKGRKKVSYTEETSR